LELVRKENAILSELSERLKTPVHELTDKIGQLQQRLKEKEKELEKMHTRIAEGQLNDSDRETIDLGEGVRLITRIVPSVDMNALRSLSDKLIDPLKKGIVILITNFNGRVNIIVRVSKDLTDRIQAGEIIKTTSRVVGGGGGGRPDLAQAGGKDPSKIEQAIKETVEYLRNQFSS
jgi:alanyl-tRNA synthetase